MELLGLQLDKAGFIARYTRLLQHAATALPQPTQAELPPSEEEATAGRPVDIKRLQAGLQYEASKGLCNAVGKELFSQFATTQFEALKVQSKTPELRVRLHKIVSGFQRYPKLSIRDRRSLMLNANSLIGGDLLRFPSPVEFSQQQAERRASNSQASTAGIAGGSATPSSRRTHSAVSLLQGSASSTARGSFGGSSGKLESNGTVANSQMAIVSAEAEEAKYTGFPAPDSPAIGGGLRLGVKAKASLETEIISPSEDEDIHTKGSLEASPKKKSQRPELHTSFAASAKVYAEAIAELKAIELDSWGGEQRTVAWHALRDNRLTASAFGNALGFWTEGRQALWEEKLGLCEKFAGNDATRWGNKTEDEALSRYKEVTGHTVKARGFKVLGGEPVTSWLGASPDGLIEIVEGAKSPAEFYKLPKMTGPGILEIKCPFNKGEPLKARPYQQAPWYYMPQVQGLMEVFDREWCNLFSYTVNSAALYHVRRDRRYWRDVYHVLADFWWSNVIPAKHALASGDMAKALLSRPDEEHELTQQLKDRSKEMAAAAKTIMYPRTLDAKNGESP